MQSNLLHIFFDVETGNDYPDGDEWFIAEFLFPYEMKLPDNLKGTDYFTTISVEEGKTFWHHRELIRYKYGKSKKLDQSLSFIESKYKDSSLLLISFIFIVFIILEFLSLNLSNYRLDPLHDGDFLTPAQNYLFTGQFWLSSYTVHGGSDFLYPLFMWKILGTETIGAGRSFIFFLILIVKLSCILLSYQLTKISTLKDSSKILFFTIFAAILISMSHYEVPINYSYFSYRDIFVILFMIFFVELFTLSKIKYLSTVLICLIATISLLFHIDIGFYFCSDLQHHNQRKHCYSFYQDSIW